MSFRKTWDEFRAFVLPADAPAEQVRQIERAYYAGAFMCFDMVVTLSEIPDDQAAEAAVGMLKKEITKRCAAMAAADERGGARGGGGLT